VGATWSPRGLYVAAWMGDELRAVAPDGRVAWGLRVPGTVDDARWSPDGFRIAYRRGEGLGVVAGDGTGGRALASRVRPATPAWRPRSPHSLAWVAADGRVVVRDVDGGRLVWRSAAPVGASARELSWSADGRLLLMRGAGLLRLADVPRDRVRGVRLPGGELAVGAAWAPRGRRLAVVARRPGAALSRVLVAPAAPRLADRPVFATTGRLGAPSWSPDGARVLVRWPEADEWLLLPAGSAGAPGREARVVAIAPVARRFGGVPVVRGWCCSSG
jgi:Tol biopolymer transport system component